MAWCRVTLAVITGFIADGTTLAIRIGEAEVGSIIPGREQIEASNDANPLYL